MRFVKSVLPSFFLFSIFLILSGCNTKKVFPYQENTISVLQDSILFFANKNLKEKPITITSVTSPRSEGTKHDFFSEGDYWWPDPENPEGPYIRRDGMSNPDNFNDHRKLLIRFSVITGNLTSAYLITKDAKYALAVLPHLKAWFINDSTRMNPNLQYSQAIHGRYKGRYIGIIDGIHLMEVAQSVKILETYGLIPIKDFKEIKSWFKEYEQWLINSDFGKNESNHPNNHGTWWISQVSTYARLLNDEKTLKLCREKFTKQIIPNQIAVDGSQPKELARTKPYGYSLFNLEGLVVNTMLLSDKSINLWKYQTKDGKSVKKAVEFMTPYIKDKTSWPYKHDVMYWDYWPVGQPSLLFSSVEYNKPDWFQIWKSYRHFYKNSEVIRNMPIRNPLIWFEYLNLSDN